jgi:hypothetical protein
MIDKYSTIWAMPPVLLFLFCFETGSLCYLCLGFVTTSSCLHFLGSRITSMRCLYYVPEKYPTRCPISPSVFLPHLCLLDQFRTILENMNKASNWCPVTWSQSRYHQNPPHCGLEGCTYFQLWSCQWLSCYPIKVHRPTGVGLESENLDSNLSPDLPVALASHLICLSLDIFLSVKWRQQ